MNRPTTVLLVDDDEDLREINRLALEHAGFAVVTASGGDEGFARAAGQHVDVAVLDVMMGTPTEGFMLARRLRADARTKEIPLVMLSAINAENEAAGSFVRFSDRDRDPQWLPVDRFVDKPVSPDRLIAIIRSLVP